MIRASRVLCALLLVVGCNATGTGPAPGDSDAGGTVSFMDGGATPPPGTDAGPGPVVPPGTDAGAMVPPMGTDAGPPAPPGSLAPGAACNCDAECEGTADNPGVCVQGVCMTRSNGACASAGSTTECPAGSRCWGLEGVTGGLCWPDCDSFSCAGACDGDGSCAPSEATTCDASCAEICTDDGGGGDDGCPPNSSRMGDGCFCDPGFVVSEDMTMCVAECTTDADCGGGTVCNGGSCVVDIGTPPPGSPPTGCAIGSMGIPDWRCTGSDCGELVTFMPRAGTGYDDYPLNGETASDQYRSYVRRDVMMLVRYAAAMVDCQAGSWPGNGGRLGLGDMSEADGAIPGTREGRPGHPSGTHVDGHDMDIAYYQVGTPNNYLRSVCEHTSGGADQYHCTGAPTLLDPWRTALFLGHLHANPGLRVIGVDGRVGPIVDSAITQLCADGWLTGAACSRHSITWEETDTGRGWFRFHHHHFHISVRGS